MQFFLVIPLEIDNIKTIDDSAKMIYARIFSFSDKKGASDISLEYLAEMSGCDIQTVENKIQTLVDHGLIERENNSFIFNMSYLTRKFN